MIYLTLRWDPNRYYHIQYRVILGRSTLLYPDLQIQFSIIPWTPIFGGLYSTIEDMDGHYVKINHLQIQENDQY